mgnify:CR=1 FL=1
MAREKVLCGKEEIIRVAVGIVDKEGMEAVSVRRIAKELGVSSMTIYNYVENLSDVKKRVLISGFDRMYGCIYEALNALPAVQGRPELCRAIALEMFKYMFTDGRQAFHADAEVRPFYAFFSKFMKRGKSSKGDWRFGEKSCKLFETLVFYLSYQSCTGVSVCSEEEFLGYMDFYLEGCMSE